MQAQVALQANQQQNFAQELHALNATLLGCDRATRLVDQLLTLSRLDAQLNLLTIKKLENNARLEIDSSTDLVQVCQNIALDLSPNALKKNQDLELIAPEQLIVNGGLTLWEILVRNILDNAIRYSPRDAKIRVEIEHTTNQYRLCIDDSGDGLTEQEIQKLGERFYRRLGTNESGSGLGWSIVRRVAAVLAVLIEVKQSQLLGGLRVEVLISKSFK